MGGIVFLVLAVVGLGCVLVLGGFLTRSRPGLATTASTKSGIGRLNEIPNDSADTQVWKKSKERQTYRKSLLQSHSRDNSESEEDKGDKESENMRAAASAPAEASDPRSKPARPSYRDRRTLTGGF